MGRNAELLGAAMGAGAAMVLEERVCATGEGFTEGAEGRERVWRGMMKVEMSAGSKKRLPGSAGRAREKPVPLLTKPAGGPSACHARVGPVCRALGAIGRLQNSESRLGHWLLNATSGDERGGDM